MRKCYLVCYDIRDPKRLRHVHTVMKGYGEAWQFSVFFCVLKDIDRVRMVMDLQEKINLKEDQVVIIDLGNNELAARNAVTILGLPLPPRDEGIVVI